MTILLDASYFLALLNEQDVHHLKAKKIAQDIDVESYGLSLTTDHILDETISVTLRKWGKERAKYAGMIILQSTTLLISDEHLLHDAWKLFQETALTFSFTDCLSLAMCRTFQVEHIATFDREFTKTELIVVGI